MAGLLWVASLALVVVAAVVAFAPLGRCAVDCASERDLARVAAIFVGAGCTVALAPAMALLTRTHGHALGLLHPLAVLLAMLMAGYPLAVIALAYALRNAFQGGLAWAAVGAGLAAGWALLGWKLGLLAARVLSARG